FSVCKGDGHLYRRHSSQCWMYYRLHQRTRLNLWMLQRLGDGVDTAPGNTGFGEQLQPFAARPLTKDGIEPVGERLTDPYPIGIVGVGLISIPAVRFTDRVEHITELIPMPVVTHGEIEIAVTGGKALIGSNCRMRAPQRLRDLACH